MLCTTILEVEAWNDARGTRVWVVDLRWIGREKRASVRREARVVIVDEVGEAGSGLLFLYVTRIGGRGAGWVAYRWEIGFGMCGAEAAGWEGIA